MQRQTSLIHNAQITTIDSFCLFIIRNNFNEIGIDPGFRVADEGEIKLLESDVMGKLLEEAHTEPSERFFAFLWNVTAQAKVKRKLRKRFCGCTISLLVILFRRSGFWNGLRIIS